MDIAQPPLDIWFPSDQRQPLIEKLIQRVGLTRIRAEYFVQLWVYLLVKQQGDRLTPPLRELLPIVEPVSCSLREAAALFYADREQGSDRSAGMILAKLAALGLIHKTFDGNQTQITIPAIPELFAQPSELAEVVVDQFDPRCDAIPVANMLSQNYRWLNISPNVVPHRIVQLLRQWSRQYPQGMRVLRRCDNRHPVGFYLLYPTASVSEPNFFRSPRQGSHLSSAQEVDPFTMAIAGDEACVAMFVRSWMIDPDYFEAHRSAFLQDTQQTLRQMQEDFPNLCDLHTLIVHPSYESMAQYLGFQKTVQDVKSSIYWVYLPLDQFLARDFADGSTNAQTANAQP